MFENLIVYIILTLYSFANIVVPFSGSVTVTPLIALLTDPHRAIALASFYFMLTGLVRIYLFRKNIKWDFVKKLFLLSFIASIIGALALVKINSKVLMIIIALFVVYFLYKKIKSIAKKEGKVKRKTELTVHLVGLLSGFLQGTGLAGSDLRNGYLYSKGLSIVEVHGTTAIIGATNFLTATIVRIFTKQVTIPDLTPILLTLPFIILGMLLGRQAIYKINKKHSDWIIITVMSLMVIFLVIKILGN